MNNKYFSEQFLLCDFKSSSSMFGFSNEKTLFNLIIFSKII